MFKTSVTFDKAMIGNFKRDSIKRIERAMLVAADRASRKALSDIRANGSIGKLSRAIGQFSDLKKGKVYPLGNGGFSATGGLNIKTRNERTVGTIKSFTEGGEILPRGKWLWIATPELAIKRVGRKKITPALYRSGGFEQRLGPLVQLPGRHGGEALLVINKVQVKSAGRGRPIKASKSGVARAGRENREFIVAFVGILRTSRTRRIDVKSIMQANANRVGEYFYEALGSGS